MKYLILTLILFVHFSSDAKSTKEIDKEFLALSDTFFEPYHLPSLDTKIKKSLLKEEEVNVDGVKISVISLDLLNGFIELYYEISSENKCHLLITKKVGQVHNYLSIIFYRKSTGESILDLYKSNATGGWFGLGSGSYYPTVTWNHFFVNLPSLEKFPFLKEDPKCYYSQHFNEVKVELDVDVYMKQYPEQMELFLNGLGLEEQKVYLVWNKKDERFVIHN